MIIAVFAVKLRVDNEFNSVDRATATVERYLYPPLMVLRTEMVGDPDRRPAAGEAGVLRVVVAGGYPDQASAERAVEYQRDRFASGLYPTTTPQFINTED